MRNAFSLDFKREVDVALCILRFQCIGILKSYTKIHTADLHHFITGNGLETKISRTFLDFYHFRARILRHFRPILCPAYRAYQTHLASRSACRACSWACQTQCNWLHDRHAGHAKPNATGFTIGMPGMPNRTSRPACYK